MKIWIFRWTDKAELPQWEWKHSRYLKWLRHSPSSEDRFFFNVQPSHMPLTCSCQQLPFQVIYWSEFWNPMSILRHYGYWRKIHTFHSYPQSSIFLDEARTRNDNNLQSRRTNQSLGYDQYGRCKASLVPSCDRFIDYHSSSPTKQQKIVEYPTSFLPKWVGHGWEMPDWRLTSNFCEIHCINV